MADSWDRDLDRHSSSSESYQRLHVEPIYETFVCPLTKQVMQDPVTLENGQTFERSAIEKWLKELKDSGRKPICPLTLQELKSTHLNPSLALRNTIDEWIKRNEASQLDFALKSLSPASSESDILLALQYVQNLCQRNSQKHIVLGEEVVAMIVEMLKNSSTDVRRKALQTLRIVAEADEDDKEAMAIGDTVRTVVKFLTRDNSPEREEAVSLLYELSKSESLSEKIGGVNGAILILVGIASSDANNILTVQQAEKTLQNLEKCERNVHQLAENGRLQPLLRLLLEGSPETQFAMVSYLGELALSNDLKVSVAQTAGSSLVNVMRSGNMQAREASLKALLQVSSCETSAKVLIEKGILPPLVRDLFIVGANQLPTRLKEVSATILAHVVSSGANFESIPLDHDRTLVSEDIIHNLLHLISNTGPAIECKLLQVLVGLTSSKTTSVQNIVSVIKSSGATISLVQFIEAPQRDLRMASIKLLNNISPYMNRELAEALCGTAGQLSSLIKIIFEEDGLSEEQAAAVGLLAELPEMDLELTRQLLRDKTFNIIVSKIRNVRRGTTRGGRFVTPYLEGLVRILSRTTYVLEDEPDTVAFARENNLASLFSDLLQANGLDNVQMVSAVALENLSHQSKHLTRIPDIPEPGFCDKIFPCFYKKPAVTGLCPVHRGICSIVESFCLVEGRVVAKLVACLDHTNEKVVEAALAALCTLLEDGVDISQGVSILCEADGVRVILDILVEHRTEILRKRSVWAVERFLRTEDIAYEISADARISAALVEAFRHGDNRTKQIAEQALKLIDKLPNFSGIFQKIGK